MNLKYCFKGTLICLFASSVTAAMANQAIIANTSKSQEPMTLIYKIARQNPGQPVQFDPPRTVRFEKETTIPFGLNGYKLAGIVPVSINGIRIPDHVTDFSPGHCSVRTDRNHAVGKILLDFSENEKEVNGHRHTLRCGVESGGP